MFLNVYLNNIEFESSNTYSIHYYLLQQYIMYYRRLNDKYILIQTEELYDIFTPYIFFNIITYI